MTSYVAAQHPGNTGHQRVTVEFGSCSSRSNDTLDAWFTRWHAQAVGLAGL